MQSLTHSLPLRPEHGSARDHLFVSYAGEDAKFAQWLTLRLTAAGYKVWCDQVKLLGGESYPVDIDAAIKTRTFRFLAVLSRHSLLKPNPLKERTLALNLQRARKEEFVIPLNLDGLRADELDWMTSDITFIPFSSGWAGGLRALLKKLDSVAAPRRDNDGARAVSEWVATQDVVAQRPETLWTNVLDCLELPDCMLRVSAHNRITAHFQDWPSVRVNDREYYAFEPPAGIKGSRSVSVSNVDWRSDDSVRRVAVQLLRQYLLRRCQQKGLVHDEVGRRTYFPAGLLENNRLSFTAGGRSSWTKVVGFKTFYRAGLRDVTWYHLAPVFVPHLRSRDSESVLVKIRVHLTDDQGTKLPERTRFRRERGLRATWWNDAWLRKVQAIAYWFSEGLSEVDLALTDQCSIVVSGGLRTHGVQVGIDEDAMEHTDEDSEAETIRDDAPDPTSLEEDVEHA